MNYHTLSKRIPPHEAVALIEHFTGRTQTWCLLNRFDELPPDIDSALASLESGTPLQYITGEAHFCGERYIVSPACLIPQPDTELIVETAARHLRPGMRLLDLCTGSGCIALALLHRTLNVSATAVDISADALEIAQKNSALHDMQSRLTLIKGDILHDEAIVKLVSTADVITANPPYIRSSVIDSLPADVRQEPTLALDGGDDGLRFYRRLIKLSAYMTHGVMVLEIGYDQAEQLSALCNDAGLRFRIYKDFGGNDRAVEIIKDNAQ